MILADKIITLRKKNGWSQEELAEKVNVSRQAVSKWEGAQTIPDLDKILQLSKIFGVSTDYLIKDEIEIEEYTQTDCDNKDTTIHKVTLEEANRFLDITNKSAPKIALGVFLCVISPITLLLLLGANDSNLILLSENQCTGIGLITLILLVAIAVALFISSHMRSKDFEYLSKEKIETEYGVTGMVKEQKEKYKDTYSTYNIIGTILCVISVIPIFAGIIVEENDFLMICAVCTLLLLVAIGCFFFVTSGCKHGAMQKLLQEGDYTEQSKKMQKKIEPISSIYWMVMTAAYLASSFITNRWDMTWIVWPVAGVLFGVISAIINVAKKN